mmetsp:Transcript_24251/g.60565  ORF Transcript_24251/g.60565 Transcript_24251/m.60565 type:complete len:427 (+) Transcript_24251:1-1281(+)
MQLFFAMLVYFMLISRAVKGSEDKIKLWEKMRMHRMRSLGKSARVLRRPSSLSSLATMDTDLDSYICWRHYFITRIVRWQQRRPAIFQDIMERLGIDVAADDASARFQDVLDKEFSFSAYLALTVASGMRDSVQVHPITWLVVVLLFALFALIHCFAHIPLASLMPGFIAVAAALLAVMKAIVVRKRRHIEQQLHASGGAVDTPPVVPELRCGHVCSAATVATVAGSTERRFHERHKTEIVMLRMLQVVLFLISYVFARFMMDTHDWFEHTGVWFLYTGIFVVLFVSLACALPSAVPLFLGMLAMPPYVDEDNFESFCTVLLQNRAHNELRMWRQFSKSYFRATGSGPLEEPLAAWEAAKVASDEVGLPQWHSVRSEVGAAGGCDSEEGAQLEESCRSSTIVLEGVPVEVPRAPVSDEPRLISAQV